MSEIKYNRKPRQKVNYKTYNNRRGYQPNPVIKGWADYKKYTEKKLKVNPVADAILSIEDLLMGTEVNWSISYEPSTKSYTIFIADLSGEEPKPKEDLDEEPAFDTEFIFETGYDCQALIHFLNETLRDYGVVTVKDIYDHVHQDAPRRSTEYGWLRNDIDKAYFKQLPFEGYLLKIAKPKPVV